MKRQLLNLTTCRTVQAVSAAMRISQICEVCRDVFATRDDPPVCEECYRFVFGYWPLESTA